MSIKICPKCKMVTKVKGKKCPNLSCSSKDLIKVPGDWLSAIEMALEYGYALYPDDLKFNKSWIDDTLPFVCNIVPISAINDNKNVDNDCVRIIQNKPYGKYYDEVLKTLNINTTDCSKFEQVYVGISRTQNDRPYISHIQTLAKSPRLFCDNLIEAATHDSRIELNFYSSFYDYTYNMKNTIIDFINHLPVIDDGFLFLADK